MTNAEMDRIMTSLGRAVSRMARAEAHIETIIGDQSDEAERAAKIACEFMREQGFQLDEERLREAMSGWPS